MGTRTAEIVAAKQRCVEELAGQIEEYGSFLVFEYLSLNSEEVSNLRKRIKESDSKLVVYRNNIMNRAFRRLELKNSEELRGPNAILLTRRDIRPFQSIIGLSREKDFIRLKLAYFEEEIIEKENLNLLASLGSREDMLAKVSRTMLSPLYKFLYLIRNLPNK